jgi:hypothetical protein
MRILVLRRLLIVVTGLSFLIGATVHATPRLKFMASGCRDAAQTATEDCCAKMAMKDHAARALMKHVPCKGISLDCANQLGCIYSQALPTPLTALGSPTTYRCVAYWPPLASGTGLSVKPNLFPPISL